MKVTTRFTNGKAVQTAPYMHEMVRRYHTDMMPWVGCSVQEIFDIIASLPFRPDPPDAETLMRPRYTMSMRGWGGDCDDKAIAMASWAVLKNIPYRFIAVRKATKPTLHHVYTELYINGRWVPADCTYNINTLGHLRERYVEFKILPDAPVPHADLIHI